MKIEKRGEFFKVDDLAQIAYGWAIVCTEKGEEYVDLQGDHIPEDVMVKAAIDFATHSRVGKDMHAGDRIGEVLFTYPVTKHTADLGITTNKTGLLIGFKPDDAAMLDLIKRGERTGFSIGGFITESEDVGKFAKSADAPTEPRARRVFRSFKINEISLVDVPAMEGATVGYVKSAVIAHRVPDEESPAVAVSTLKSTPAAVPAQSGTTMADQPTVIVLTEAQHALYKSLAPVEAEAFLAKSNDDRDLEITKARDLAELDSVIHTCEDGKIVRKRDGSVALEFAKERDESIRIAKAESAAREQVEIEKRAETVFAKVAGKRSTHAAILKAVEGLNDPEALAALQSMSNLANEQMTASEKPAGIVGDEPKVENPQAEYDALVIEAAKSHDGNRFKASAEVLKTARGAQLYTAISKFNKKSSK